MTAQKDLQSVIETFVRDIQGLAAEVAKAQLIAALGGAVAPAQPRARKGAKPTKAAKAPKAAKAAKAPKAAKGKRIRRSPEELAELEARVIKTLTASPRLTSEEIQSKLGMTKAQLQLPLTEMRDKGVLKTVGERRGMRYFVAGTAAKK